MDEHAKLELLATLRKGYCSHTIRVNICAECLSVLEKIVREHKP